jgi:predicted HicB family RNase H-like nuclease
MNNMTYRGYAAQMDFDTDDKIIVGRVIDIDGIITFHGTFASTPQFTPQQSRPAREVGKV